MPKPQSPTARQMAKSAFAMDDDDEAPQPLGLMLNGRRYRPQSDGQARLSDAIDRNDIVFCEGVAGTGKTYAAIGKAAEALDSGKVRRVLLYRPYIGTGGKGRKMGSVPGDAAMKMAPMLDQLLEYFEEIYGPEKFEGLVRDRVIRLESLEYIRSKSFRHAFVILDEAQNALEAELNVFLTRLGVGSNLLLMGDLSRDPRTGRYRQCDVEGDGESPYEDKIRRCAEAKIEGIAHVKLTEEDCVRHPLVRALIRAGIV